MEEASSMACISTEEEEVTTLPLDEEDEEEATARLANFISLANAGEGAGEGRSNGDKGDDGETSSLVALRCALELGGTAMEGKAGGSPSRVVSLDDGRPRIGAGSRGGCSVGACLVDVEDVLG